MSTPIEIHHDAAHQRFVALVEGQEATLRYRQAGQQIDLYSTFVPETLRGRGIAEQLAKAAFEHATAKQLTVLPTCSYLSGAYLKRHPEYLPLTTPR